jgi:hypothetical protein
VRRLAFVALLVAAACGSSAKPDPGPLDQLYFPTGVGVVRSPRVAGGEARLLVASSNADLRFDDETGGAVVALDPAQDPVRRPGGLNVRSFAGDLALTDPEFCGTDDLAVFATRGSNTLNVLRVSGEGALSCDACDVPLTGTFSDPLAVAVACQGAQKRAFVGHLASPSGQAWITEYDLANRSLGASFSIGAGPARAFAYDHDHDRLYVAGLATGTPTPLRWIELGGCTLPPGAGGCTVGEATFPALAAGLELRSIALSDLASNPDPTKRRAYLTGRSYSLTAAATAGARIDDSGGVLLVVDLVENPFGGVDVQVVREEAIGRGAQDVRVLPPRVGKRDLVAALSVDDAILWIYDDETTALKAFPRTGPEGGVGHQPYGLAVDPEAVGSVARIYVGSFGDSFVTPVHVPVDAASPVDAAFVVTTIVGGNVESRRIRGGTP